MKITDQFSISDGKLLKRMLLLIVTVAFAGLVSSCGPKTKDIQLTYLIKDNQVHYQRIAGSPLLGVKPRMKAYATVTNTSDYPGVFKFYVRMSSQGNTIELNDEQYLAPGQQVQFTKEIEINPFSFEANVEIEQWGITAPTKTIVLQ